MISALFWNITQRRMVGPYRRFGKTYLSRNVGRNYHSTLRWMPKEHRSNRVRSHRKSFGTGSESCLLQGCLIKIIYKFFLLAINTILVVNYMYPSLFLSHRVNKYFKTKGQNCREWNTFFMTLTV